MGGGSGLYDIEGIENVENRGMKTPFGPPSDSYVLGRLCGVDVCFLPRHGRGHRVPVPAQRPSGAVLRR